MSLQSYTWIGRSGPMRVNRFPVSWKQMAVSVQLAIYTRTRSGVIPIKAVLFKIRASVKQFQFQDSLFQRYMELYPIVCRISWHNRGLKLSRRRKLCFGNDPAAAIFNHRCLGCCIVSLMCSCNILVQQ